MKKHFITLFALSSALALSACGEAIAPKPSSTVKDVMTNISALCGQIFEGQVTSDDPQDEDWRKETLVLGPISCPSEAQIMMPLAVGENKSRTWFLTWTGQDIEFRHQHLLDNGDVDPVSDYGGFSQTFTADAQGWRVEFPADEKTVNIFNATGLQVSTTNVWSFDYVKGKALNYELNREGRHFRAEFDVSMPK